jgi:SAM-dependent methyltransferase
MDSALDKLRTAYDESPYPLSSYPLSAPGHLATIGHLFGLDVPEVSAARVLEIGCAVGGNLIPFAASHPRSRVVGIDLSPVQIAKARDYSRAIDLDNVEFLVTDIADVDAATLGPVRLHHLPRRLQLGSRKCRRVNTFRYQQGFGSRRPHLSELQRLPQLEDQGDRAGRDVAGGTWPDVAGGQGSLGAGHRRSAR